MPPKCFPRAKSVLCCAPLAHDVEQLVARHALGRQGDAVAEAIVQLALGLDELFANSGNGGVLLFRHGACHAGHVLEEQRGDVGDKAATAQQRTRCKGHGQQGDGVFGVAKRFVIEKGDERRGQCRFTSSTSHQYQCQ
jgi:hypothetical protein